MGEAGEAVGSVGSWDCASQNFWSKCATARHGQRAQARLPALTAERCGAGGCRQESSAVPTPSERFG